MAKKHLGQNFLFDPAILRRIVDASGVTAEDTVVEIGPGPGRLTHFLSDRVKRLIAIELDADLFERLGQEVFPPAPAEVAGVASATPSNVLVRGNVELVHADALLYRYDLLPPFKVVANIPYYITSPIIFKLLEHREKIASITVSVQREVAERIVAHPGGKDFGIPSLIVQYYAQPEIRFIIPRGAFRPVPKVDSAVIHLAMRSRPPVDVLDERFFFTVIKTAFHQRRKTLANSLKALSPSARELLASAGIEPTRRPETLAMEEFARIADVMRRSGI